MKGGRRGRRGGRRQKRREEKEKAARQEAPRAEQGAPTPQHEHVHEPEPASGGEAEHQAAAEAPTPSAAPHPPEPLHPRPMSARELVARLEAKRLEQLRPAGHEGRPDAAHPEAANGIAHGTPSDAEELGSRPTSSIVSPEPRRFAAAGQEWIARLAGCGTGGTGRVAQARVEAIHFSTAAEPERVAAEVLVPRLELDALYDDELAELLERGLRSRTENG